jgi:hypothetical protein
MRNAVDQRSIASLWLVRANCAEINAPANGEHVVATIRNSDRGPSARPPCARCGGETRLFRRAPHPGLKLPFERWSFECATCQHVQSRTIHPDWSQGVVMFICPKAERPIDSGIGVDLDNLLQIRNIWVPIPCPYCDETHEFEIATGFIDRPA